jgi:branched-subunit amino acid transport protein
VSLALVPLALVMAAVTYPSRAVPLLVPGIERMPAWARTYLRLVGPAVLSALAAVNAAVVSADGRQSISVGITWLAVAVCVALMYWRRNLFVGLASAVVLMAVARQLGLT